LEDISSRNTDRDGDHDLELREKDEEIEVYKSGMEQALMELEELRMVSSGPDTMEYVHANLVSL
jgi:hypothetical protein